MTPYFSLIIPVYNSEGTLKRCLDSVMAQTYSDFEVLLVDDGSTDGSLAICREYAGGDARFSVIHKDNGGASSARNVGIDAAKGNWITFADSDDELFPRFFGLFNSAIESGGCENTLVNLNVEVIDKNVVNTLTQAAEYRNLDSFYNAPLYGSVWNKAFKKSILDDNGIRFDTALRFSEDCLFVAHYCSFMDSVVLIKDFGYRFYFPGNYRTKYAGSLELEAQMTLFEKIRDVNADCSKKLVDGLLNSILDTLSSNCGCRNRTIESFKNVVGADIRYVAGVRKLPLRLLAKTNSELFWRAMLGLCVIFHRCRWI